MRNNKKIVNNDWLVFKRLTSFGNLIIAFAMLLFYFSLPKPLFNKPTSFVIEDSKGELLNAGIAADGQWRFPEDKIIPQKFIDCIVTFEDKRFFKHPGVDLFSMARAIRQNLNQKRIVSGGSTLSMQVIRLSQNKKRTIWQKTLELLLAIRLEFSYSKKEILSLYAANAPFGSNVVGLEAASWRYYGRKPALLSWGEMATLAVLPNAPSLIYPGKNRITLLNKRNRLLNELVSRHIINKETAQLARLEPLPERPLPLPQYAPHLLNRFKKDFALLNQSSTTLKTTINATLQKNTTAIIQNFQGQYATNGINNIAALVLDVESGNTLAYVGNIYKPQQTELESHVDMIPALRSPGSTLKPLLYAAMLNDGMILPNTLLPDIPTQIAGYTPQNADLGYDGAIPASKALSRSLNIPAVKMLQLYKYERFHQLLKKTGVTSLTKPADFYGLSMILGGCETSMWQLAGAYASMARTLNHYQQYDGKFEPSNYHEPNYISNKPIEKQPLQNISVYNYAALYDMFNAMEEVMRPGEEVLWRQFSSSQQIAWKTGTSFGFRDGWAIGVTTKYVVCVWVGNADGEGRPGLTGIATAAPVMFNIFGLLPKSGSFNKPYQAYSSADVCTESGFKAGSNCATKVKANIPTSGLKSATCPFHQLVHLNKNGNKRVNSTCFPASEMTHKNWFVLPAAMEFYYRTRHKDYASLPPFEDNCVDTDELRPIELIYPKNNAKVYIPTEIDGKRGKTVFNAALRNTKNKLFWSLDDNFVATTTDFHSLELSPKPGLHTITLTDNDGNRLVQVFTVLDKSKNTPTN